MKNKYGLIGKTVILGGAAVWTERKGMNIFSKLADELPEYYKIIMVGVTDKIKKSCPQTY